MELTKAYKTLEEVCRTKKRDKKTLFECYQSFVAEKAETDQTQSGRYRQRPYEEIIKKQDSQDGD